MPLAQKIMRRVRAHGRGKWVFTAKDFEAVGSRAAVDQALARLARTGTIRRIARGVYDLPRTMPRIGPLSPQAPVVARAVARQTHSKLAPSGPTAANALGLTTQVPARQAFLTSGPSRRIQIGRLPVELRHARPIDLLYPGTPAGMAVTALRYLGRQGVPDDVADRLSTTLKDADKRRLRRAQVQLPAWIRSIVGRVVQA